MGPEKLPAIFGKYALLELIARGGMAEVYRAAIIGIEEFHRIIALKRILPQWVQDEEFISMFVDEARICEKLSGPNIVQALELGKVDDRYYIAMEYVPGHDLRHLLAKQRSGNRHLSAAAAAYIVSEACAGLHKAHTAKTPTGAPLNVVHRDVNPANILVSYQGAVKVVDFGIARAKERVTATQAGTLKGMFAYMSPEYMDGKDVDQRADVFALGAVLFETLTNEKLFEAASDFATIERIRRGDLRSLDSLPTSCPQGIEDIIRKACALDRSQRYETAEEMQEALEPFMIRDSTIFGPKKMKAIMIEEYVDAAQLEGKRLQQLLYELRQNGSNPPPPVLPTLEDESSKLEDDEWLFATTVADKGGIEDFDLASQPTTVVGAENLRAFANAFKEQVPRPNRIGFFILILVCLGVVAASLWLRGPGA